MAKKALYNLIRMNHNTTTFALPSGIYLADDTDVSGANYFRFELPLAQRTRIGDLVLRQHHVSVYESAKGKIDFKSQYHYTAYFHNAAGKEFRLHAFFDSRDFFVARPELSVLNGRIYEPVNSDDLSEVFAHLASTSSAELVAFLRSAQKSKADALQHQFNELEHRLEPLASDPVKNKNEYLNIVTLQIQVLEELSAISNKSADVIKKMRWLVKSKHIIELEQVHTEQPLEREDKSKGGASKDTKEKDEKVPAKRREKKGKKAKAPTVNIKPAISGEIAGLKLQFSGVSRVQGLNKINLLNELYAMLKDKETQIEFNERTATVQDLNDLRVLRANIEKSASELLQRFVLLSDFNHAELLTQFHHLLPDNLSLLALQGNRPQLLDFLLKHHIVSANIKNFTIKDVVYPSMVDYFFNGPASDDQKIACLEVLIKRGVSLMEIENKTGLPYAALLLAQQNHPLRAVLERNPELTLNSVEFYSKMNQVLRSLASESRAINVDALIENNKEAIVLLQQRIAPHQQHDPQLELSLGQELAHQIETDPEISYQAGRIRREVALLIPHIREATFRRDLAALTEINFDLLVIEINQLSRFEYIPPFEDLKRTAVKLQLGILEYLSLINETMALPFALAGVNLHARKESKELKAAKRRALEIDKRIVEIRTMLTYAYGEMIATHLQKMIGEERRKISFMAQSKALLDDKVTALKQVVQTNREQLDALAQAIQAKKDVLSSAGGDVADKANTLPQALQSEHSQGAETGSDDKEGASISHTAITFFGPATRMSTPPVQSESTESDDVCAKSRYKECKSESDDEYESAGEEDTDNAPGASMTP